MVALYKISKINEDGTEETIKNNVPDIKLKTELNNLMMKHTEDTFITERETPITKFRNQFKKSIDINQNF